MEVIAKLKDQKDKEKVLELLEKNYDKINSEKTDFRDELLLKLKINLNEDMKNYYLKYWLENPKPDKNNLNLYVYSKTELIGCIKITKNENDFQTATINLFEVETEEDIKVIIDKINFFARFVLNVDYVNVLISQKDKKYLRAFSSTDYQAINANEEVVVMIRSLKDLGEIPKYKILTKKN